MATYEQPKFVRSNLMSWANLFANVKVTWDISRSGRTNTWISKTQLPVLNYGPARGRSGMEWASILVTNNHLRRTWRALFNEMTREDGSVIVNSVEVTFVNKDGKPVDTRPLDRQMVLDKLTARK